MTQTQWTIAAAMALVLYSQTGCCCCVIPVGPQPNQAVPNSFQSTTTGEMVDEPELELAPVEEVVD